MRLNAVRPSGRTPQSSPSRYADLTGGSARASAMAVYLEVQSRPVRVNRRTSPLSRRAAHTVAIQLEFIQPLRAVRSLFDEGGQLGRYEAGRRAACAPSAMTGEGHQVWVAERCSSLKWPSGSRS